ncbi:hypothetical protein [Mesorhizobium sp.]|uniref:hypothetical protein n=1 Tax=Mesorhizobium sp. TaxID=1871066 RepID=UPI00122B467E|nr:hypothetical protein [Mesorhizobium sp.]TIQ01057.1 MAG: hypothetical protein E5X60_01990 [Mesorhizobium sp.]TJW52078.1 MAG: hypothetical protein E5X59_08855 [Mesorhizobium sp.]
MPCAGNKSTASGSATRSRTRLAEAAAVIEDDDSLDHRRYTAPVDWRIPVVSSLWFELRRWRIAAETAYPLINDH